MTERQKKVLELIQLKESILNIKDQINITDKELIRVINSLSNKGYNIENRFLIDGGHHLTNSKYINKRTKINIDSKTKISFLAISDTHFISKYEDQKSVDQVYDFATKEGIKYIFHLGDFIHGGDTIDGYQFSERKFLEKLKEYPKDDNITTFLVLGNHDLYPTRKKGIYIAPIIKSNRLDIIPLGIYYSEIDLGLSTIELTHKKTTHTKNGNYLDTKSNIILSGHQHIFNTSCYINEEKIQGVHIHVPSISDMIQDKGRDVLQKGFVKLDISINTDNNKFEDAVIEQYMFLENPIKVGDYQHHFQKIKK